MHDEVVKEGKSVDVLEMSLWAMLMNNVTQVNQ